MKRFFGLVVLALIAFIAVALFRNRDQAPPGEGSYREANEIVATIKTLDPSHPESDLPEKFYRITNLNGFSYLATGTDSHLPGGGGGTIGVLFDDGSSHMFFGHVCGPGAMPFEFFGDSKAAVLAYLREKATEYKP
jgi:hypothetical protein